VPPQVCTGDTGHAEVVRVTYDPAQVTYPQLLGMFFAAHDPTQRDRQGVDVGSQYRSIVLYHGADQLAAARWVLIVLPCAARCAVLGPRMS
jgi:peptide-methionine (S)-S-oxide reductase